MKELDKLWATTLEVVELAKKLPEGDPLRIHAERTKAICQPLFDQLCDMEKMMTQEELQKEWSDPQLIKWVADLQKGMDNCKKQLSPKETMFEI
jgi:hypothetical protein